MTGSPLNHIKFNKIYYFTSGNANPDALIFPDRD